jgi:hypothetical protein
MYISTVAQNIHRIEYFFNTDPGFGNGITVSGFTTSANIANFSTNLNLNTASNGVNVLYLRAKDDNGNWSLTNAVPILKANLATPSNIVRTEYFFNTDPGFGSGISVSLPSQPNDSVAVALNLATSPNGMNTLFIRSLDAYGVWSLTNAFLFLKSNLWVPGNIVRSEYFFNTDPGFGNGIKFQMPASDSIDSQVIEDGHPRTWLAGHRTLGPVHGDKNGWTQRQPIEPGFSAVQHALWLYLMGSSGLS